MKLTNFILFIILILFMFICANGQSYCANSWKKGNDKIIQRTLSIHLDKKKSSYNQIIYNSGGEPKYQLFIAPGTAGKDLRIIEWMVTLTKYPNTNDKNLLKPTDDDMQDSFGAEDYPGWFYLEGDGKSALPFLQKRVIKISGFYCILEVKDYRKNAVQKESFDSIDFNISFVNTVKECS